MMISIFLLFFGAASVASAGFSSLAIFGSL
jgi:hypothetical protein